MNEEDFDKLIDQHQGIIWKVCKTFLRHTEDQKDLFQEILYKLWKGRALFQEQSKVSTWIYKVSLNLAIDKSRKLKRRTSELNRERANSLTAEKAEYSDYDVEALYQAIDRLKPIDKALILLYLEQESYKDIAEVIGISEKNVSVKLVRIKEKLKKYYLDIIRPK